MRRERWTGPAHRGIDTLVLLMAGATLRESIGCMLDAGWLEGTPVGTLDHAGGAANI